MSRVDSIASGNLDLSTRTETQATALAEVAGAMQQLIESVRQNAALVEEAAAAAQSLQHQAAERRRW